MAKRISIVIIKFTSGARDDLLFWQKTSPKTVEKINRIMEAIIEEPGKGIGKPEKLKYGLTGLWSRRINHKDRIVYEIVGDILIVLQLRDHFA
jgi:toxin YoeB